MQEVLTVLKIMHSQNYGHFAIHPGHIMLKDNLAPILIGFRHAFNVKSEKKNPGNEFPGQPGYTAP